MKWPDVQGLKALVARLHKDLYDHLEGDIRPLSRAHLKLAYRGVRIRGDVVDALDGPEVGIHRAVRRPFPLVRREVDALDGFFHR